MDYKTDLKEYVTQLKKSGLTYREMAQRLTNEGKEKLSGSHSKWSNADIAYLLKGKHAQKEDVRKEFMEEILNSNMDTDVKIRLMRILFKGLSN